ncbi:MAG: TRIC cation channel family protein, partial [Oscillospiraceae bacterium]|nr:TRIC cation channel family protein [Oscillospiraceae bacterium]
MDALFTATELAGTIAFAVSGAMLAVKKRLDIFGILFLGLITALGGGTIRDLLLGHTPPRMFYSVEYILLALLSSLAVFFVVRLTRGRSFWSGTAADTLLTLSDAFGLGTFAVIGTQAGITDGFGDNAVLCIFLGMVTGVGGGVLRDMMCTDIPFVLRKHIYAV